MRLAEQERIEGNHMLPYIIYRIKDIFLHIGAKWDKLAPEEHNAIQFAHEHINQELYSESSPEIYQLAHSGEYINKRRRKGTLVPYDFIISQSVSKNTTDIDLVLYRGVFTEVYKLMKGNAKSRNCDLYEKGFLATSIVKGHEIGHKIKLRIFVPAGTKCIYTGNINHEQLYYEVDIMHDARLKIISIDNEYINCLLLETA